MLQIRHTLLVCALFFLVWDTYAQEEEQVVEKGLLQEVSNATVSSYKKLSNIDLSAEWKTLGWSKLKGESTSFSSGPYQASSTSTLESGAITLPKIAGRERINLHIKETFQLESGHDFGIIQISDDAGKSWIDVSTRSGKAESRQCVVNLSGFSGKSIKLRALLQSDESNQYEGWTLESITLQKELLPSPLASQSLSSQRGIRGRTQGTLTGNLGNLDAQRFPRFIFANVNVLDGGSPISTLDESNFFVTEFVENPADPTQTDELEVNKDEFFKVFPPDGNTTVQKPVDIVFIMDNSGSMGPEQAAVAANVESFVTELENSGFDYQLGLTRFGQNEPGSTNGQPIYHNNAAWYSDASEFVDVWNDVNIAFGGTEPSWQAMYFSASEFSFRPAAQKIFIHITDEAMVGSNLTTSTIQDKQLVIDRFVNTGVTCYVLVEQGAIFDDQFGTIATATGGRQYDIEDSFNDILQDIGEQIENTYTIRYTPTDPRFDGKERGVEIRVSNGGGDLTLNGSYRPGAAPIILRTNETLALEQMGQLNDSAIAISVNTLDWLEPFTNDVTLFYRTVGDTNEFKTLNMGRVSGGVINGTDDAIWTAIIPRGDVLAPGIEYYVRASDGDLTITAPEFIDLPGYPWSFAVLPNEPPIVNHTPITESEPSDAIVFTAEVTDNTNVVAEVKLYYRSTDDFNFIETNMTRIAGTDNYRFTLPAPNKTTVIEYYIVGIDDFGVSTFEGTETSPFAIGVGVSAPDPTQLVHTMRILNNPPFVGSVTIGDTPLAIGDEIGVYYTDDNNNLELGGSLIWAGPGVNSFPVYGDDPATPEKDGFVTGEAFVFRIKRASDGKLLDATHSFYVPPSSTVFGNFRFSFIQTIRGLEEQRIVLEKGLNLWSTYLDPVDKNLDVIFSDVMSVVSSISDSEGNLYVPGNTGLTTFDTYTPGYGLRVLMDTSAIMTVQGDVIDPITSTINIKAVGTIIASMYPSDQNVEDVIPMFDPNIYIVDRYLINSEGDLIIETYSPAWGINGWTYKNMEPGEGYQAYGFVDQTFTYPAATDAFSGRETRLDNSLPQVITSVDHYMHIWVPQEAGTLPDNENIKLRVYAKDKMVGEATYSNHGSWVTIDGFNLEEGTPLIIKKYNTQLEKETLVHLKWATGNGSYANHQLAVAEPLNVDGAFSDIQVFPNPSDSDLSLRLRMQQQEQVTIDLLSMDGKIVKSLSDQELTKGVHEIEFDTANLEPGLYIVRIKKGEVVTTAKWMRTE